MNVFGEEWIEGNPEKNLWLLEDEKLNTSQYCVLATHKENHILGSIKRGVNSDSVLLLYPCEIPPGVLCSALGPTI